MQQEVQQEVKVLLTGQRMGDVAAVERMLKVWYEACMHDLS